MTSIVKKPFVWISSKATKAMAHIRLYKEQENAMKCLYEMESVFHQKKHLIKSDPQHVNELYIRMQAQQQLVASLHGWEVKPIEYHYVPRVERVLTEDDWEAENMKMQEEYYRNVRLS